MGCFYTYWRWLILNNCPLIYLSNANFSIICLTYLISISILLGKIIDGSNGDVAVDHYHRYMVCNIILLSLLFICLLLLSRCELVFTALVVHFTLWRRLLLCILISSMFSPHMKWFMWQEKSIQLNPFESVLFPFLFYESKRLLLNVILHQLSLNL